MSASEWLIAGLALIFTLGMCAILLGGWAAFTCDHPIFSRRRTWFKHHRYVITCSLCQRTIGRGRDVGHRYPDEAPGVRRGRRVS